MDSENYFLINCPKCNDTMEFPSTKKGTWAKCTKCKELITIPISGLHEYPTPKFDENKSDAENDKAKQS